MCSVSGCILNLGVFLICLYSLSWVYSISGVYSVSGVYYTLIVEIITLSVFKVYYLPYIKELLELVSLSLPWSWLKGLAGR